VKYLPARFKKDKLFIFDKLYSSLIEKEELDDSFVV